jgi:cytochrome b6-f complex iron-sulfur subunit
MGRGKLIMSEVSRREFLNFGKKLLVVTGLAAVAAPIVAFFYPTQLEEIPSEPVSAGSIEEIPMNSSKTIRFGRYPALIIKTPEGLRAYSAVCTHFACIVKWDPELKQIVCPCHEGYFDARDGSVISGPPPSPLEKLAIEVVEDQVYIGAEG